MHTCLHTDNGDCAIIWYPRVDVKHTRQIFCNEGTKNKSSFVSLF